MNETFMKEKPIFPLLLGMGMPMVLSMLVNSLYNIVDSYFVARISENAMEALSLVFPIQNFINAMAIGFGVGINALIATARGAGKENEARRAATQGVVLSVIHGIILSVICIVIMPKFLGMFTGDQEVIRYGVRYAPVAFLFSPIIMAGLAFEKIFQAVGRMKVSMIALLGGCITNIILDPILIFGLAFFPKMGISGAAIATGVGQLISLIVYLVFYFKGPVPVKLEARYKIPGGNTMKKLYGIGIPAILNLALPSVMIFVLNGLLAQYSRSSVVILGIYDKLQTFHDRCDHGGGYTALSYNRQHADRSLYGQCGDYHSGRHRSPDHQRRIYRLHGVCHSIRRPRGNRHGRPVPGDLIAPLHRGHPSIRFYFMSFVWRRSSLECVLDHGVFGSSCS